MTRTAYLLLLLCMLFAMQGLAQKKNPPVDKDAITKEVKAQLDVLTGEGGELKEYCVKSNITGSYEMDITVHSKGKILTVFMVSSSTDDIKYQNMLKAKLMTLTFANVKLPKNERVKFRHTLNF